MSMMCRQCEQTMKGQGCSMKAGVCGKDERTAALQDLLIHALKGLGYYGSLARENGIYDRDTDRFVMEALFTTITNVNFDGGKVAEMIIKVPVYLDKIKKMLEGKGVDLSPEPPEDVLWSPAGDIDGLVEQGRAHGIMAGEIDEDVRSLREILLYGLKGIAAYADHAAVLGKSDETVSGFFYKALSALADTSGTADDMLALIDEAGAVNLKCMEMLDKAHTETFGHPVPTPVPLGHKKGPAILISGHDLEDLRQLLEQTAGKGVNIYTHGEMLPAHGYPELNKYEHLAGHYGGAWQDQQKEFAAFPGAVLMTTNCIQKPLESYKDNIFTTGLVRWPDVVHVPADSRGKKDLSRVIERAVELGGFNENKEDKKILVGFAHNAVLSVADKVVDAVKSGDIKHFFLIGGCDGAKSGRNYYTELAEQVPDDCVILTLACGKFRFNKLEFGDIDGIPRLLDCGQCNDAYSAIKIASALADVFDTDVNGLPLSLILSWYEQKAVCILLTLLHLGIKDMRLGPSLPAFISPNVLKVLVEKFDIKPISTPEQDLKTILG